MIPEDIVETNNWYRSHLMPVIEHAGSRGCKHVFCASADLKQPYPILLASSSITIVVVEHQHPHGYDPSRSTTVNERYIYYITLKNSFYSPL